MQVRKVKMNDEFLAGLSRAQALGLGLEIRGHYDGPIYQVNIVFCKNKRYLYSWSYSIFNGASFKLKGV